MMMAASPIFLDTNVLVYATRPSSPWHTQARAQIRAALVAGRPCCISNQVIREYYATMTRPDPTTGVLPSVVTDVLTDLTAFQRAFTVLEDTRRVVTALLTLVQTTLVGGRQIHDANIAATMISNGITELLTHNTAHFARFAPWITVVPLDT